MYRFCLTLWLSLIAAALPATAMGDAAATRPAVKIGVMPFVVSGEPGREWIGRAMQEGLAGGLGKLRGEQAILLPGPATTDAHLAQAAAQSAGANYVIFGFIQCVGQQMRVSGQILAIPSGQCIASLGCDGNIHQLFALEDVLTARAGRLILPPATRASTSPRPPAFAFLGTAIPSQQSTYFDGNLSSVLSVPDRYQDQYNQYYFGLDSAYWYGGYGCWGYGGWCGGFWGGGGWGGPQLNPPAGPVGTW